MLSVVFCFAFSYVGEIRGKARAAAEGLHGMVLDDGIVLRAQLGSRNVTEEEVAGFSLAAPRVLVQLVSPPPSPPEWWDGWHETEGKPRSPPELRMDKAAPKHVLHMHSIDLFEVRCLVACSTRVC